MKRRKKLNVLVRIMNVVLFNLKCIIEDMQMLIILIYLMIERMCCEFFLVLYILFLYLLNEYNIYIYIMLSILISWYGE